MSLSGAEFELVAGAPAQQAKRAEGAALPVFALIGIVGRRSFLLSMFAGVAVGLALAPVAADEAAAVLVAFGALCVAAVTARRAFLAESKAGELEQKLLDEASYHAFVDSAIEGFFRTTRDGRYLIVNPALAKIYGYDSPAQLMRELTDIGNSLYVDPGRRRQFEAAITAEGTHHGFVSRIRRRDGSLIWIKENARTVRDADGQFLFYEGTVEDITAQVESQEAVERALRETQEAALAKAAFLAAMSHELKTPLNAVIGFSDVMLQGVFGPVEPARYRSYVSDIHENGKRLLAVINDILDLSRIEGRVMGLEEHEVCLPAAAMAARDAAISGRPNPAPIALGVPETLPLLRADARRLHQILSHLLSNALKFTPSGGHIELRAWLAPDGCIAIAVADTGIGMAPEFIGHALEPFKQLDARLARRFEGVGLGLPLANALAKLHGGRLTVDSTPGAGTTVTIEFPPERTIGHLRAAIA